MNKYFFPLFQIKIKIDKIKKKHPVVNIVGYSNRYMNLKLDNIVGYSNKYLNLKLDNIVG